MSLGKLSRVIRRRSLARACKNRQLKKGRPNSIRFSYRRLTAISTFSLAASSLFLTGCVSGGASKEAIISIKGDQRTFPLDQIEPLPRSEIESHRLNTLTAGPHFLLEIPETKTNGSD